MQPEVSNICAKKALVSHSTSGFQHMIYSIYCIMYGHFLLQAYGTCYRLNRQW